MAPGPDDAFPHEHVCLGGTFSPFHRGHKALVLRAMAQGRHVFIGVTHGALAKGKREREVPPAAERIKVVESFLAGLGVADRAEVAPITEPFGRALEPQFEAIVVTEETESTARRINQARTDEGHDPLAIVVVPFELGLDGLPVNGTRVARGEVDPDGVEPKRVHLALGTTNPVKIEAAKRAFGRYVPVVEATGVAVDTGVPEQPYDGEGPRGAVNRARAALDAVEGAGLGVGIEAAIATNDPSGEHLDVQYCAIVDGQGRVTLGHGPGFGYPPAVAEALRGGASVGDALARLSGNADIGRDQGAIGFLTRGGVTRQELTEWAVLMAIVPRLQPVLYRPLPYEARSSD